MMVNIIEEIEGLYQIIEFKTFRKTEGVTFDLIPLDTIASVDSLDRVLHKSNAVSPEPVGDVEQPWYMHTHQADNLVVLYGKREVDIYTPEHGKIEHFTVTANSVHKNGKLVYEGGAMLVWPRYVFHRIVSGQEGSASLNLAQHYQGFDIKTNFNIYKLDTETGDYEVLRAGHKNQL
ncbi:hypothetical protein [Petrocella sp. FN5]|uniref:hypothetical protein n=1 Tax=Petrocella sp. FN5 TaxID=3032002 RepID=UPI0023DAE85A|nr:hypothetical protein [Petrocella sp. FN5]MDF1618769.1 hypothetical protein [Petrocella sp. FN5]